MLTDQLLEHWNLDEEAILAIVHEQFGATDVCFGGSLADDLGSPSSDIDLYCFHDDEQRSAQAPRPIRRRCGGATLELHAVSKTQFHAVVIELQPLLLSQPPLLPHQWPLLSPQAVRQLHAVFCNRWLEQAPERNRRDIALAELLPVYVALRSTWAALSLVEDAVLHAEEGALTASVYCARLASESALDAALAVEGAINPNPKWRLLLTERTALTRPVPSPRRAFAALFPEGTSDSVWNVCLPFVSDCLERVAADAFLRRFPTVAQALPLLGRTVGSRAVSQSATVSSHSPGVDGDPSSAGLRSVSIEHAV